MFRLLFIVFRVILEMEGDGIGIIIEIWVKTTITCSPDISQKMLTVTLRSLEADGLVSRQVFAEVPPRVEYSVTERAKTLVPHINTLVDWAMQNLNAIITDRQAYAQKRKGK